MNITSKIEGYENLTAEEKLAKLEALELDEPKDNSEEIARYKKAIDKTSSEVAEWKRKYNEKLTEEERAKEEREAREKATLEELETLKAEKKISEYKAKYLGLGYPEDLAEENAKAIISGDMEVIFANQKKVFELNEAKIKSDMLDDTKKPSVGANGGKKLTKEEIMQIKDSTARQKAIKENIELFTK